MAYPLRFDSLCSFLSNSSIAAFPFTRTSLPTKLAAASSPTTFAICGENAPFSSTWHHRVVALERRPRERKAVYLLHERVLNGLGQYRRGQLHVRKGWFSSTWQKDTEKKIMVCRKLQRDLSLMKRVNILVYREAEIYIPLSWPYL